MRIALLSDIHGNLTALNAVLAELAAEQIDQYLCLGDVVEHGPQPRATLARVLALNCPIIIAVRKSTSIFGVRHSMLNNIYRHVNKAIYPTNTYGSKNGWT